MKGTASGLGRRTAEEVSETMATRISEGLMTRRKIIKINEALCNGCGNCMTACAEGAIHIVNGKARVISDRFCDGLGACIGECPTGALSIEERVADEFNEEAAKAHLNHSSSGKAQGTMEGIGKESREPWPLAPCDISLNKPEGTSPKRHSRKLGASSQLSNWPIQMRLANADAPYFKGARLLIAADCSGFASPSIAELIKGRVMLIGCPKLDETELFVEKLVEILRSNDIKDITVLHMEVPCCSNLVRLVLKSIEMSHQEKADLNLFICAIDGCITEEEGAR